MKNHINQGKPLAMLEKDKKTRKVIKKKIQDMVVLLIDLARLLALFQKVKLIEDLGNQHKVTRGSRELR